MNKWNITICQLASQVLDVAANEKRCCDVLDNCTPGGLAVFPEMFLSGYEIGSVLGDEAEALKKDLGRSLARLREKTAQSGADILISYPLFEGNAKPYIALEYISGGRTLALHRKINLCNYAQYTEHLNFRAGDEIVTAKTPRGTAGLFVCEDLWHVTNAIFAAKLGAQVLFYPCAATVIDEDDAPDCFNNWQYLSAGTAFSQTCYVVCCNQARAGGALYFGGSHVISPDGSTLRRLPFFEEAVFSIELDMDYLKHIRAVRPLLKNERFEVYKKYI